MPPLPEPVERLLDAALVGELTVVRHDGRPITYPLIPLWDGERIYLTSSVLFSRKLDHIKADRHVALSITDPVATGGQPGRATIQGTARVIDEDPHGGWERLMPIWERKEPAIVSFLKARFALPLFFERALIEITPTRVLHWPAGDASVHHRSWTWSGGRVMAALAPTAPTPPHPRPDPGVGPEPLPRMSVATGLAKLTGYPYVILTWSGTTASPSRSRSGRRSMPLPAPPPSTSRPASPRRATARSR